MKCVIIINSDLPTGLIANTSAVLALSIGKEFQHLIGEDVMDSDGIIHRGITNIPIPLLKGNNESICSIRKRLLENSNSIYYVDFCDIAQKSKQYNDYKEKLQSTPTDQLEFLGIALYGPKKQINKLTGSLALLR